MWDQLTVLSISEVLETWLDGLCSLPLHTASLSKIEDLRCCVLGTFACPSSLCNTSSSHLLTGRKCFPHYTNDVSTHTNHQINPNRSVSVSRGDSVDGSVQRDEKPVITSIWLV